ncbi:hypothetical protein FXO38_16728 [Capsicum annuum]|nr:hypothetical protein FXO38_16728 [Capsicum annuum]
MFSVKDSSTLILWFSAIVPRLKVFKHFLFLPLIRGSCTSFYSTVVRNATISRTPVTLSGHCLDILPYCVCCVEPQRWFWVAYWGERQMAYKVSLRCNKQMVPGIFPISQIDSYCYLASCYKQPNVASFPAIDMRILYIFLFNCCT